jgi:hypothetical protein
MPVSTAFMAFPASLGPIVEVVACWAHARFFELARLDKALIAIEAVRRIAHRCHKLSSFERSGGA